jgi:hypothetical protein
MEGFSHLRQGIILYLGKYSSIPFGVNNDTEQFQDSIREYSLFSNDANGVLRKIKQGDIYI